MKVICFGDSNTYGYDPRGFFADRYPAKNRWVDLLSVSHGWDVINAGVNGREIPSNFHFLRLPDAHISADMFLVMLGTNDLLQGAAAKEAAVRMEAFLSHLLPFCKQVVLVAPPPLKRGAWVPADELVTESILLAEKYDTVAANLNIPFINTCAWNVELAFDGVHFTEAGHHIFAEKISKELLAYCEGAL